MKGWSCRNVIRLRHFNGLLKRFTRVKSSFTSLTVLLANFSLVSQVPFSNDPDSSVFLTKDIDNFWKAFDEFQTDTTVNPFGSMYIDIGSAGVRGFIPYRIESADHLFDVVKNRRKDYEQVRGTTLQIGEKEKQCRSIFYALKYWYAEAQYPPVYFIIGAYNSGGTFNEYGLFIGAEKQTDVNNIPYIVAHELAHFKQKNWSENPTLLQQSTVEGSADFLGELISGTNTNQKSNDYGDKNEEELCQEFIARMDGTDYRDWLYGTVRLVEVTKFTHRISNTSPLNHPSCSRCRSCADQRYTPAGRTRPREVPSQRGGAPSSVAYTNPPQRSNT